MKLELTNENYCATIIKINNLVKLDGLDNLMGVPIYGFQGLVGKIYKPGQLAILFTAETQLSEEFCFNNNLFDKPELNKDKIKGYISSKRRIRAIKLRGHKSSALILDLSSLSYLGIDISKLNEGDSFNSIDGIEVCKKYEVQTKSRKGPANQPKQKVLNRLFPEHMDTSHWERNKNQVDDLQTLYISQKLHGCVEYNTIIDTLEFGKQKIGYIVDNKIECKILARDLDNQEDIYVPIDNYYFKANNGDWYEIELENGQKLTITGNNPVWLPELSCYRRVDELIGNEEIQLCE